MSDEAKNSKSSTLLISCTTLVIPQFENRPPPVSAENAKMNFLVRQGFHVFYLYNTSIRGELLCCVAAEPTAAEGFFVGWESGILPPSQIPPLVHLLRRAYASQ